MKKTKEECLLINGIMGYDLGKNEARIMKAMDDFAEDVVKNCTIPDVSHQRELLAAFVKDWYKNNPLISEERQLEMVDKFLAAYSG
jgi:hypothetical protein